MCMCEYGCVLKSFYDNIVSGVDFFNQWDSSTTTQMEEVYTLQEVAMIKNKPHSIIFHKSILVGQWTFHLTFVYIYMCVCVCARLHVGVCICVYMCVYIYWKGIHVFLWIYVYMRIDFYLLRTFWPHLGSFRFFLCVVSSAKFHLWTSSGDLPRPRIGILSLVAVSPVITAFHSCCLSQHVFDQVNFWVGFETAIFWQCSPGTVETQRLYPLRHGPRGAIKDGFFGLINPYLVFQSRVCTEFFVLVFNWNHFEMRLLNLRINFYLLRTFCPHLGSWG